MTPVSYTTLQQLTDRFGDRMLIQLTDRADPPDATIDAGVVDRALADTAAVIDGYLAARYVLPLAAVPPLVADLALTIAIYKLHVYMPDPKIEADHREALRQLQQIATGTIRLPLAGIEPVSQGGSGARMTDRERPLTADNLKGFI